MAKKKKSTTKRKRRVSGVGKINITGIALAVGGAFVANKLTAMTAGKTGIVGQISPFLGLIGGIVLPMFVKNPMAGQLAVGMAAGGGLEALKKLGVISGPYQVPVVSGRPVRRINGGAMSPNMIGNGYSPARNSVNTSLSVISGAGRMNGSAMGF